EQQLGLFADRTSSATLRANQLRLYFSSFAYVLLHGLRRLGLTGTAFAKAQSTTIRLKLLKIGARLRLTARKVWLSFQVCLRPRDRFWDIPVPKIDSAFDNLFVPQPSWSPSTTQQLRKLVAAPYLAPNDWTPRSEAYFASPLALCARRVSSAASRLLGSTSLRFALHGWQRRKRTPTPAISFRFWPISSSTPPGRRLDKPYYIRQR
ncbi:transposase, partial [Thiolapillus sp.]|uniref:transposase n=1 Tax=Thiolapillus sp. TaxID=2017437 RepID=UPI003AF6122C